jgi:hypothetical protein
MLPVKPSTATCHTFAAALITDQSKAAVATTLEARYIALRYDVAFIWSIKPFISHLLRAHPQLGSRDHQPAQHGCQAKLSEHMPATFCF